LWLHLSGSLYYKMWVGLNGFDPRNDLVLSGVRIGMGCMNLVTAISRSTWVPVTLSTEVQTLGTAQFMLYIIMRTDGEL